MEKTKKPKHNQFSDKSFLQIFEKALGCISFQQITEGLDLLRKIEKRLETHLNKGLYVDSDIVIGTLHNIALCYQVLHNSQECSAYLEACIFNIKSTLKSSKVLKSKSEKIRKIRYLCLLYIQISDCFSKLNNHQAALENAKKAVKCSILAVKLCLNFCNDSKLKKNQGPNTTHKNKIKFEFYQDVHTILQYLYLQMNGKKFKKSPEDLCIKSVFGVQKCSDWIFSVTFSKIFEIKALTLNDLKNIHSFKAELSKDFMLDKICMAVSSYYLLYRELEFLKQEPSKAKSYLKIAISISDCFFPNDSLLKNELHDEFNQKFRKNNKNIKDSTRSKSAKVIKNGNHTKNNKKNKKIVNTPIIPWLARSERNPILNETIEKSQSETVLKKKMQASLECNEKNEPEPPLSEENSESDSKDISHKLIIFSSELYGDQYEEEPDKYEYMPLKLYDY